MIKIDKTEINKGQIIIEVLIALAVCAFIVSAAMTAVTSSLSNAQYSKAQNIATHYAEEGMEYMRKLRNQDWNYYYSNNVLNFLPAHQQWAVSCLGSSLTPEPLTPGIGICSNTYADGNHMFIRTVRGEKESSDCGGSLGVDVRKIIVTVAWSDSKCTSSSSDVYFGIPGSFCHQVKLSSCFSDKWRVPTS